LVGINTELLCGFRIESIRRILYKNTTVSRTLYDKQDGEFVQWYKREWTDYDAKDNETSIPAIKELLKQLFIDS
jgi:hypothetical protein